MQRTLFYLITGLVSLCGTSQAAQQILLRLNPSAEAPVIAKITASEKVILDTAPAPANAELGWRQLALPTPFEGYVPLATLSKDFVILKGTPVHYLPTASSARITRVEAGDHYEVVRVTDEWATVRFRKNITGYFIEEAAESVAADLQSAARPPVVVLPAPEPAPRPAPVAIPAPRARVNPDEPIGNLDPNALPAENVIWQPAQPIARTADPAPRSQQPASLISEPIMVTPAHTQAREAAPEFGPAKTPRLLTGQLVRKINVGGPAYPIQLKSPEGRLIAYVDFSGIYISDLAPYIDQKVYLRGQIYPLPNTSGQLVILADSLRLAE